MKMSHDDWELNENPIPKFASVNRDDARVYMTFKDLNGESRNKVGLYAATLAIAQRTGLYRDVSNAFGPLYGNGIMDYAMFSIAERSSSTQLFEESMAFRMIFSKNRQNDAWFSLLFSLFMTQEAVHRFKTKHMQRCAKGGIKKVWLCVDGSNNHCSVRDSDLAE